MGLGLPWTMADGKVVLLQRCGPAVKERGPRPHRLKPLECIVVSKYLEWHSHEVRPELGYCPHDSQALQFSGRVGLLSLVESPGSAADEALLAIADLSQDSAEACSGGVGVQPKGLSEVREGSDGAGRKQCFQLIEGGLAFGAPVEDGVQRTCNCSEVLYISPVITGETQEGADFRGSFGR